MKYFDVYPRYDIDLVKGQGCTVWDSNGQTYLDLYCGHAVISIGHSHPSYVSSLTMQLSELGFYSNSVKIPIQDQMATKLGESSGYEDYSLFLCNSGAEATENAMKLASFHTGRKKIISFKQGFHGRTSLALEATDDMKNRAPVNETGNVIKLPLNDLEATKEHLDESVAAVIIEGIQGIAGIYEADLDFLKSIEKICRQKGALLILDEVQSGYGRSGKFFAHQYADIQPDLISVGKGMGNGFPLGGVLIAPKIEARHGLLGTTFGGNHLACTAGLAVLEVLEKEDLIHNAASVGSYLKEQLVDFNGVKEVRGKGLMIGIELEKEMKEVRKQLLLDHHILTGSSSNQNTLRILPPLCLKMSEADQFLESFQKVLS